jgi:hypothetical protein
MSRENEDDGGQFADGSVVPRRTVSFGWPIALLAAIAVHQVTGSPIAGASLFALHAGWKSFRCGVWLKRVDPVASRAWACLWFYIGAGCWRAAAWTLVAGLVLVEVSNLFGQPLPEKELFVELFVFAGCICLTSLLGLVAVASALRGRVRVWVHPSVREACHSDFARLGEIGGVNVPNLGAYHGGFNHAEYVVALSLIVPAVITATAVLICSTLNQPRDQVLTLREGLLTSLPFTASLAMIPIWIMISRKVVARAPAECWRNDVRT